MSRVLVLPGRGACLLAAAVLAGCAAVPARMEGEPVAQYSEGGGVAIALYREPCALAAVSNLPHRAVWRDARGKFEGCFAIQHGSIVAMYFEDRTVVTAPVAVFTPTSGSRRLPTDRSMEI